MPEQKREWYDLKRVSQSPLDPGMSWLTTAAVRSCNLCGEAIDGMGGPGRSICIACGDDLLAGRLRGLVKR